MQTQWGRTHWWIDLYKSEWEMFQKSTNNCRMLKRVTWWGNAQGATNKPVFVWSRLRQICEPVFPYETKIRLFVHFLLVSFICSLYNKISTRWHHVRAKLCLPGTFTRLPVKCLEIYNFIFLPHLSVTVQQHRHVKHTVEFRAPSQSKVYDLAFKSIY